MTLRLICSLIISVLLLSCATPERPKYDFPAGTHVGIINHLEGHATHHHFSSLRFDSFSKQIKVDWDIPGYIDKKLSTALQTDPRYRVSGIKPAKPAGGLNQEPSLANRTVGTRSTEKKLSNYLASLGDRYQLDVIILVRSYAGPSAAKIDKQPIELKGYGLFSRQLLMSKQAFAYANIAVEVFKARPMAFIGSGVPQNRKSPLDNIDLDGSLKSMPQSEIEKLEPLIKEYADQAVENALVDANLLPSAK